MKKRLDNSHKVCYTLQWRSLNYMEEIKRKEKDWNPTYQKVLVYIEQGMTQQEIADKLNIHKNTVYNITKTRKFKTRKAHLEGEVQERVIQMFKAVGEEAAEKFISSMRKGTSRDRIQLDAAKEILHQIGVSPVERTETVTRPYSDKELESMRSTAQELLSMTQQLSQRKNKYVLNQDSENKEVARDNDKPALVDKSDTRTEPDPDGPQAVSA